MYTLGADRYLLLSAVENLRIHFKETRPAIDRTSLRRIKGNRRGCAASSAIDLNLDSLTNARCLCEGNGSKSFIFCLLTFLAAFLRVLKLLVAEKNLFSDRPDKAL